MRSRFSAYKTQNYQYILDTYTPDKQQSLSTEQLEKSDRHTRWLTLVVNSHSQRQDIANVDFSAYFRADGQFQVLHELSNFRLIEDKWYYLDGTIHPHSGVITLGRNDLCLCGSGKKYKKCCL